MQISQSQNQTTFGSLNSTSFYKKLFTKSNDSFAKEQEKILETAGKLISVATVLATAAYAMANINKNEKNIGNEIQSLGGSGGHGGVVNDGKGHEYSGRTGKEIKFYSHGEDRYW